MGKKFLKTNKVISIKKLAQEPTAVPEQDNFLQERQPVNRDRMYRLPDDEIGMRQTPEVVEPEILTRFTPMDMDLLTRLNKQREDALAKGDIDELRNIETQVIELIEKYVEPLPISGETYSEAFIGRLMQSHVALRRDKIPLLVKAGTMVKSLSSIFNIQLGAISLASIRTDDYELETKTGDVEFAIRIRPISSKIPYRFGLVKISIRNGKGEFVPYIWDSLGRKYNLDSDGIDVFFGVKSFKDLKVLEEDYIREERKVMKGLSDGSITPNVYGLGKRPQTPPVSKGISFPKTEWASKRASCYVTTYSIPVNTYNTRLLEEVINDVFDGLRVKTGLTEIVVGGRNKHELRLQVTIFGSDSYKLADDYKQLLVDKLRERGLA